MVPRWLRRSIRLKLIASALVFLVVTSVPSLWMTVRHEREVLWEQIDKLGRSLAMQSAAQCQEPMAAFDYPKVQTYVQDLAQEHEDVVFLNILRKDGKEVAAYPHEFEWDPHSINVYTSDVEIGLGNTENLYLGRVTVLVSTRRYQEIIASRIRALIFYTALSLGITTLALLIVTHRFLLKPLQELDSKAQLLGDGRLDEPIRARSKDEVGRLALNLELMRTSLQTSYVELRDRNTELNKTLEQLSGALVEARKADKAKGEFLATVSHEIRTPMNGVLGMTDLVLDTRLDDEQREYAEAIRSSAEALLSLVNDILDFAKSEANHLELEESEFDLHDLVAELVTLVQSLGGTKSLQVTCMLEDEVPRAVRGDSTRLRQVILNLLANAVKFTEQGSISLHLSVESREKDAVVLLVEVRDTGIGFSPEHKGRLFAPFVQADSSPTRRYEGAGLGLAISRRLVELMNGTIDAESEPGEGSRFFFTARLGLARLESESIAPQLADHPGAAIKGLAPAVKDVSREPGTLTPAHVLVVEDNPLNLKLARRLLEKRGHHVTVAVNGRAALEAWEKDSFDLILMDCQMPEMDGYEATREIRRQEESRGGGRVPIVALTANAMPGDRERCLAEGMDEHLAKPVRPHQLDEVLRRRLTPPSRVPTGSTA